MSWVIEAKYTRLTHKTARQLHLVAESCTICSSLSRRPVRKLLTFLGTETTLATCFFRCILIQYRHSTLLCWFVVEFSCTGTGTGTGTGTVAPLLY